MLQNHLQKQSIGGTGASPHTSLSEEGKKLVDQQMAAKDDKIAELEKQLHLMTMESNSLQETKKQLEVNKLQQITEKYEDLLKYTKGISQALKEREEHINKQSTRIAQLRKEAQVSNFLLSE